MCIDLCSTRPTRTFPRLRWRLECIRLADQGWLAPGSPRIWGCYVHPVIALVSAASLIRTKFTSANATSSTLLGQSEGGGEPVERDGLPAQGAGAEDEGEHDLQFAQGLVEGHPGAATYLYRLGTASIPG